ncbi:MAG TPA: ABC transporter ATP-binding protein [Nitrospiraceae bacterium]
MVRLNHVSKEYRRDEAAVAALRDVSVDVRDGEFCALMGPSGCGKSTLLNIVAGLDHPTSGDLYLEGRATTHLSDREWTGLRRSLIGMVFQSFHLLPTLTAEDNVALPLLLQGENGPSARRRAVESLARVGMEPRARHRPGELSGGEQQRVAIARALVHRPRLLLADEPTGNLDSRSGAEVVALLQSLSKELKQTVLLVTHSQEAARAADRIHTMRDGQLES